ncbi:MAG: ABC transporter ATP-binding protein [Alphaproteobacteria bacterium]
MINIKNLTVRYGDFIAVDNITFSVKTGEIYGFIGSNGAGKTTTMRVMATLLMAASGTVEIAGMDVENSAKKIRNIIGYMPDFFGVYDNLRVWEYLDFFADIYNINSKKRKDAFNRVLDLTKLETKRNEFVNNLSRGMKQRLGLARALLHNPKLLILDEPASGLDPRARVEFRNILSNLSDTGVTIFISSHILTELSDFCHTACILEKGKIIAEGNLEDIAKKAGLSEVVIIDANNSSIEEIKNSLTGIECQVELLSENRFCLRLELGENFRVDALKKLINANINVSNFSVKKTNLEDVFMRLSKGELA